MIIKVTQCKQCGRSTCGCADCLVTRDVFCYSCYLEAATDHNKSIPIQVAKQAKKKEVEEFPIPLSRT